MCGQRTACEAASCALCEGQTWRYHLGCRGLTEGQYRLTGEWKVGEAVYLCARQGMGSVFPFGQSKPGMRCAALRPQSVYV